VYGSADAADICFLYEDDYENEVEDEDKEVPQ